MLYYGRSILWNGLTSITLFVMSRQFCLRCRIEVPLSYHTHLQEEGKWDELGCMFRVSPFFKYLFFFSFNFGKPGIFLSDNSCTLVFHGRTFRLFPTWSHYYLPLIHAPSIHLSPSTSLYECFSGQGDIVLPERVFQTEIIHFILRNVLHIRVSRATFSMLCYLRFTHSSSCTWMIGLILYPTTTHGPIDDTEGYCSYRSLRCSPGFDSRPFETVAVGGQRTVLKLQKSVINVLSAYAFQERYVDRSWLQHSLNEEGQ